KRDDAAAALALALPVKEELAKAYPHNPQYQADLATGRVNQGVWHLRFGKPEAAADEFRLARAVVHGLPPDLASARLCAADLTQASGDLSEAGRGGGKLAEADTALLEARAALGRPPPALPAARDCTARVAQAFIELGKAWLAAGKLDEA